MKMPKLKLNDKIIVSWIDTVSTSGWLNGETLEKFSTSQTWTMGFFYSVDKNMIKLSHTVNDMGDRDCTAIPIDMIKKIKKFKD